jgi:ATP-dependent DNA ligase
VLRVIDVTGHEHLPSKSTLDGYDLRAARLIERKRLLEDLLGDPDLNPIHYSQHFEEVGSVLFRKSCELGHY